MFVEVEELESNFLILIEVLNLMMAGKIVCSLLHSR